MRFLWVLTILSTLLGGLVFVVGVAAAKGAPQEASAAAIGIGLAVGPYVLARAASEIAALNVQERQAAEAKKAASAG